MDNQKIIEAVFIATSVSVLAFCSLVLYWLFLWQRDHRTSLLDVAGIAARALVANPKAIVIAGVVYGIFVLLFPHGYAFGFFLIAFTISVLLSLGVTGFLGYEWKDAQSQAATNQRSWASSLIAPTCIWFLVSCVVEWLKSP